MIITIDGPAGTGKSTVAQAVAEKLHFDFLDTGAMYRAVGLAAIRQQVPLDNPGELAQVAGGCRVEFDWSSFPPGVLLNGEPVGHLIRNKDASSAASRIAVVPAVRELLVLEQRRIGRQRPNLVTEGRDQGTVVFPEAACKFFLDAQAQERARRRVNQLRQAGQAADYQEILDQIIARDKRDSTRTTSPMVPADDAHIVDTTHLTQQQVVDLVIQHAQSLLSPKP